MFSGKFVLLIALTSFVQVECIISRPETKVLEKKDVTMVHDSIPEQSVDRDYVTGYEDHYGHGGHGLSSYASYGEGFGYEEAHHGHHHEDHHHHHHHDHGHHKPYDYHKALAIKGLLVPLAGVALLGAAAAFVSNPILLQLGVISGATVGRKRRDVRESAISEEDRMRLSEIKLLEKFMAQFPAQEIQAQEKKMLASYLTCSGTASTNPCLERLACELHSPEGISMPMEANVLTIVVNDILANDFIPEGTKMRILNAVHRGKKNMSCEVYKCQSLEPTADDSTTSEENASNIDDKYIR